jgi:hypothetical protein
LSFGAVSQDKLTPIDKSPMDVSYCPANYPILKVQQKNTEPLVARVIYSRPAVLGRRIFGDLLEFGKIWRVGANEATELEFFKDVYFNKIKVKKGRYTIYMIPNMLKWTFILNKETDTWGAFGYDLKKDQLRMDVSPEVTGSATESLTLYFDTTNSGNYSLNLYWENVIIAVPFSTNK